MVTKPTKLQTVLNAGFPYLNRSATDIRIEQFDVNEIRRLGEGRIGVARKRIDRLNRGRFLKDTGNHQD